MKVLLVLGTRPEIIRLSRVIPVLDRLCELVVVHTGQNWDERLNDVFFRDLDVRPPDHALGIRAASFGEQVGRIIAESERVIREERPDRILILGDTNSGLAGFVGARMGIPVYHMEAGNRCFDDRVPEEVNRRVIDHSSTVLLPYTEGSRANLLREGIPTDRVIVTGNPIAQVLDHYYPAIDRSRIHDDLGVSPGNYLLVTLHRQENVDVPERLRNFVTALDALAAEFSMPVVWPVHPRTVDRMGRDSAEPRDSRVRCIPACGFLDFVALERSARLALTDSGTVQEECCILGVPAVTLRDVTERPETIECGSNMLAGADPEQVLLASRCMWDRRGWQPPDEYLAAGVAETVTQIVLGYRHSPN